ncbi:MAG TPA: transporter [Terracidiphilus sp.]|jgi:hypothetical protein|nr:transporter [Terracidiphilus sp.]
MPSPIPHPQYVFCVSNKTARRNLKAAGILVSAILLTLSLRSASGQGCVLARSPEDGMPTGQGGILAPGHFQLTIGERHQFSYQHFVGDVYQVTRQQAHNQVENRINLITANLTYQWTPRISVEVDAPFLFASRKTENSPIKYQASGVGDTIFGFNAWIRNPSRSPKTNVSVGLGIMVPTGNDDVTNNVNTNTTGTGAATNVVTPVDYSIQPGNGGWGLVMQWAGYTPAGKSMILYWDGDYIATQGGTNGVQRGATLSSTQPLNNYVAISDQYLVEAGALLPVWHEHGIGATFGPRWEGVPSRNLFPVSNDGFRRPGFAVTLGPGIQYAHGPNLLQAGVYKAVHRDRTTSYPDSVYGSHGDAAFAQYVWLASWTHRF